MRGVKKTKTDFEMCKKIELSKQNKKSEQFTVLCLDKNSKMRIKIEEKWFHREII